jgi:hypothetical protein
MLKLHCHNMKYIFYTFACNVGVHSGFTSFLLNGIKSFPAERCQHLQTAWCQTRVAPSGACVSLLPFLPDPWPQPQGAMCQHRTGRHFGDHDLRPSGLSISWTSMVTSVSASVYALGLHSTTWAVLCKPLCPANSPQEHQRPSLTLIHSQDQDQAKIKSHPPESQDGQLHFLTDPPTHTSQTVNLVPLRPGFALWKPRIDRQCPLQHLLPRTFSLNNWNQARVPLNLTWPERVQESGSEQQKSSRSNVANPGQEALRIQCGWWVQPWIPWFSEAKTVWWCTPVILALRSPRQEDHEFEVSLSFTGDPVSKSKRVEGTSIF